MDKTILKKIGLSDHEITVYLKLLEAEGSLASKIGDKIGMNRTQTYDILKSLISKGLVSYVIKDNKRYYMGAHPDRLVEYVKEKEKEIKDQEIKIQKIIPELLALRTPKNDKTKVQIYCGKEGIKTVYNNILKNAKEYFVLGASGTIAEKLEYYFPQHENQRIKKKISLRLLFNKAVKNKKIAKKRSFSEIKFLPKEFSSPIPTTIYNDIVIILVWTEPLAIVIENKEVSNTYKKYFNLLWKIAKK